MVGNWRGLTQCLSHQVNEWGGNKAGVGKERIALQLKLPFRFAGELRGWNHGRSALTTTQISGRMTGRIRR